MTLRTLETLSSLSLVPVIGMVMLWIYAQRYEEHIKLHALNTIVILHLDAHQMVLCLEPDRPTDSSTSIIERDRPRRQASRWRSWLNNWNALGFGYGQSTIFGRTLNTPAYYVGIPYWFILATVSILPAIMSHS